MTSRGFVLLPVVLAMTLAASVAYLTNRDNGINTSLIGTQADRERARYAAEAGLHAVNYAVQGKACAGGYPTAGAPVTDADFGGGAYTAYANSANGWPLTLTSTGTFNGQSVTLSRTAIVYQAGVRTWTFQPGPGVAKDTFVSEDHPDENRGSNNELKVEAGHDHALIAFGLSPLPPGSRIVRHFQAGALQPGGVISLYQEVDNATSDIDVLLIKRDWVAGTADGGGQPDAADPGATWNYWNGYSPNAWPGGPGKGYDERMLGIIPETRPKGWIAIDVTAASIQWMDGLYPNFGIWLRPSTPATRNWRFTSSDEGGGGGALRPRFIANYLLPCGATAPA